MMNTYLIVLKEFMIVYYIHHFVIIAIIVLGTIIFKPKKNEVCNFFNNNIFLY